MGLTRTEIVRRSQPNDLEHLGQRGGTGSGLASESMASMLPNAQASSSWGLTNTRALRLCIPKTACEMNRTTCSASGAQGMKRDLGSKRGSLHWYCDTRTRSVLVGARGSLGCGVPATRRPARPHLRIACCTPIQFKRGPLRTSRMYSAVQRNDECQLPLRTDE